MRFRSGFKRIAAGIAVATTAWSLAVPASAQSDGESAKDEKNQAEAAEGQAAEGQAAEADAAEADAAEADAAEADSAGEKPDIYAVPEGTPGELLEFAQQLLNTAPPERSAEGIAAHREKLVASAIDATTQVLDSPQATPQQAARAAEIKLQMLSFLARTGGEDAEGRLQKFKEQIRGDDRQAVRMVIMPQELLERLGTWPKLDEADKKIWMNDLLTYLLAVELDAQDRALVAYAMNMLGNNLDDKPAATELVNLAVPIFKASQDEEIAAMADQLLGSLRFMNLEGSQMVIEGQLLDGEDFDWSQYKDKVVLVDFWATWCGPCIRELPNVLANYERYHGKGFEVVGISLDTSAEKVKEFVEQREIPWPILFSHESDATGWEHPLAVEYGIHAIPAAVLVDKSGKVVTKDARGDALGKHLQELLGDPLPVEDEEPQPEAANKITGN